METGLTLAPLSLTMFAIALLAGKRAGRRRPASIIRAGFGLLHRRHAAADPDRPARGLRLGARDPADRSPARASACSSRSSTTTRCRRSPTSASARPPASTRPPARSACRSGSRSPARSCSRRCRSRSPRWRTTARCCPPAEQEQVAAGARGRRAGAEQHPARGAARRTSRRTIQDEIIRINTDARPLRAAGRAARPDPRRPARAAQRVPDDAPARPGRRPRAPRWRSPDRHR